MFKKIKEGYLIMSFPLNIFDITEDNKKRFYFREKGTDFDFILEDEKQLKEIKPFLTIKEQKLFEYEEVKIFYYFSCPEGFDFEIKD